MTFPLKAFIAATTMCAFAAPCYAAADASPPVDPGSPVVHDVEPGTAAAPLAENSPASGWKFDAAVYLWAASISADTTTGQDINVGFSDILNNLDLAAMGTVRAHKDKWTLIGDFIYLNIEDKNNFSVSGPQGLADLSGKVKVQLKSSVVTAAAGYRLLETDNASLDAIAGARVLWVDVSTKLKTKGPFRTRRDVSTSDSDSVIDGIVGLSGDFKLSPQWYLSYHAAAGTGQSQFTWQAFGGVGYHFKKFDAELAYRYMGWKFKSDIATLEKMNIHGPLLGVRYHF